MLAKNKRPLRSSVAKKGKMWKKDGENQKDTRKRVWARKKRAIACCPLLFGLRGDPVRHLGVVALSAGQALLAVPRAAVGPRPLQNTERAILGCRETHVLVPWAPIGARPLQNVGVTSSGLARPLVPRASVGPRPLQNVKPAPACGTGTHGTVPRTSTGHESLEDVQMALACGKGARPYAPRTSVGPQPLEHL